MLRKQIQGKNLTKIQLNQHLKKLQPAVRQHTGYQKQTSTGEECNYYNLH